MTQLKRWLDDDIPSDIARMIRAGRAERPTKRAVERTLLALGATSAVATITSTAVGASSKAIGAVGSLATKWAVVSVLGLGVAATTAVTVRNFGVEPKNVLVSSVAMANNHPSRVVSLRRQLSPSSEQPVTLRQEQETKSSSTPALATAAIKRNAVNSAAVDTPSAPEPAVISADSASVADAQLPREMQFIDRARTAMRVGDPALCLQILEDYRRSFERKRLGPESAYLRMQAALKMGDRATAMEVAREILRRYPSSPHVGRAEELLQRESEVPDSL